MNMRTLIFAAAAGAALAALCADGVIRRLVWQVETSDPVARNWPLTYGETVDMEVRYFSYRQPMDLSGSTVVLHARTNGMAEGWSWQKTGEVYTAAGTGWARVRVAVDELVPTGLTSVAYVIAATSAGGTNLLSAAGTLRLSGTGAGLYGAPLPAPVAAELAADVAALEARVDALPTPAVVTGIVETTVGVATQGLLRAETDAAALAALSAYAASNQPSRIALADQIIDATGGVWRVSAVTNQVWDGINYDIVFPLDPMFETHDGHRPVVNAGAITQIVNNAVQYHVLECTEDGVYWVLQTTGGWENGYRQLTHYNPGALETWASDQESPPSAFVYVGGGASAPSGTATIHYHMVDQVSIVTNLVDAVAYRSDLAGAGGGVSPAGGSATNLTVIGWLALPQTQPTNLVIRLVSSNNVIIAQEVYP